MTEQWSRTSGGLNITAPQWSFIKVADFFPGNTLKRIIIHRQLSFFANGTGSSNNYPGLMSGGPNIEALVITSGVTPPDPLNPQTAPDQDFTLYYGGMTFQEDWTALYFDHFISQTDDALDTMSRRHVDPTPTYTTRLWYVWNTPYGVNPMDAVQLEMWFSAAVLYTD